MRFNCEKLEVYQLSRKLVVEIYKITEIFPPTEKFGLTAQLRRSAVSICLNIAEGSGKWSRKDFANFIRIAIGSTIETDTGLKLAIDLKFISKKELEKAEKIIEELYFKLIGLHKSLTKQKTS